MNAQENMQADHQPLIVITGAAKRLGAQIARYLSQQGACVLALHYHNSADQALSLSQELSVPHALFQADLQDEAQCTALISRVQQHFARPVTALINNAALFERDEWDSKDAQLWAQHFALNLRAPFLLSQALALQSNLAQGTIINIIDQRVLNTTPHFLSYSLSKSALWTLTQQLALALAPKIRVSAIAPGFTLAAPKQSQEHFLERALRQPLAQPVESQDICRAVDFLLKSSSVTGTIIPVDAGQHLGWKN